MVRKAKPQQREFYDCDEGWSAIKQISVSGCHCQPVKALAPAAVGVWFPGNWERGCLVPDLWFGRLEELTTYANLGRKAYDELKRKQNSYVVEVTYDNQINVRYDNNHEARLGIIRVYEDIKAWPLKIVALNPYTGEVRGYFRAWFCDQPWKVALRPLEENPPRLPEAKQP